MARVSFRQLRVLVAEDSRHMRRILEAMLAGFGCDVYAVGDGATALNIAAVWAPDILITNINMPGLDGLALTRAIRNPELSADPFQPIILLTAYSDPEHLLAGRDAGADEFLFKPVQPAGLYQAMRNVLDHSRSFIRTKTYFGPDRRRNAVRRDASLGRQILIGKRIVRDFADRDPSNEAALKSGSSTDAA